MPYTQDVTVPAIASLDANIEDCSLTTGSPFLDLPRELRDAIYQYALPSNKVFYSWDGPVRRSSISDDVAILRTNKQVNKEASNIFFGENWFEFDVNHVGKTELADLSLREGTRLHGLGRTKRDMIRRCRLDIRIHPKRFREELVERIKSAIDTLSQLPIKQLHLDIDFFLVVHVFDERLVRLIKSGLEPFRQLQGFQTVKIDGHRILKDYTRDLSESMMEPNEEAK